MKKAVTDFVNVLGGTTAYSGKNKAMFIKHPNPITRADILIKAAQRFPNKSFSFA